MFYHHVQTDTSAYYGVIKIYHYSTQLFSCQSTDLDGHRMTAPCPESEFIHYRNYGDPKIHLKYYVVDSLRYLLLRFLEFNIGNANGREAQIATRKLLEVVLLFDDEADVEDFSTYVHRHLGSFDELFAQQTAWHIEGETPKAAEIISQEIRNSCVLKTMQEQWKDFRNND